ncbi:Glycogenin-2 [Manis pentadactyla]|nr:Glycogenin-2 [Manis pentadactyla]
MVQHKLGRADVKQQLRKMSSLILGLRALCEAALLAYLQFQLLPCGDLAIRAPCVAAAPAPPPLHPLPPAAAAPSGSRAEARAEPRPSKVHPYTLYLPEGPPRGLESTLAAGSSLLTRQFLLQPGSWQAWAGRPLLFTMELGFLGDQWTGWLRPPPPAPPGHSTLGGGVEAGKPPGPLPPRGPAFQD